MKTKTGAKMNQDLKQRIITALCKPEHEGKTQKQLAGIVGVHPRTMQNYLTADVWAEVHQRRLDVINQSLQLVDQAVYMKAIKGDMAAARILYSRWDQLKNTEELKQTLQNNAEDEDEIKRLEKQIQELEDEQDSKTQAKKA